MSDKEQAGSSGSTPSAAEFKAMFAELLDGTKRDILDRVKESIDQVYTDFEYVESEDAQPKENSEGNSNVSVTGKIDELIQTKKICF